MSPAIIIAAISQILTMSGIVSIRMFLPVFLYCLIMRLALAFPQYVPDLIIRFAEKTPSWQLSWPFLTVFGILAAVELAAVRNAEIKRFLVNDFDRYAKPIMSILIAIGIVTNVQSMGTQELLNNASASVRADFFSFATVTTVVAAIVSWSITEICCKIRAVILEKLDMIAPGNTLYMQSITNGMGELILVGGLLLMVFLPILSLILVLIGFALGMLFKQIWKWFESRHKHLCAACREHGVETGVYNSATICPECGAEQPDIRRVGWFGFSSSAKLDGMAPEKHAAKLLAAHRCRWCATPLNRESACDACRRPQWDEALVRNYVKTTDIRCAILMVVGLLCFWYPVCGLLIIQLFFPSLAVRPLLIHLNKGSRFFMSFLMIMLNLLLLILGALLSMIPGIGLLVLVPYLIRYLFVRRAFLGKIRQQTAPPPEACSVDRV